MEAKSIEKSLPFLHSWAGLSLNTILFPHPGFEYEPTSDLDRLSNGKGDLPFCVSQKFRAFRTKETPRKGRGLKTLLGSVSLFPPNETFPLLTSGLIYP